MPFAYDCSIETAEAAIQKQQLTIARLRAADHEVADAERYLQAMMQRFALILHNSRGNAIARP